MRLPTELAFPLLTPSGAPIGDHAKPAHPTGQPKWRNCCPRLWITMGTTCGERRATMWTSRCTTCASAARGPAMLAFDLPRCGTHAVDEEFVGPGGYRSGMNEVEIRRSSRRKRTVRAYREGDKTIVLMP